MPLVGGVDGDARYRGKPQDIGFRASSLSSCAMASSICFAAVAKKLFIVGTT